jgi:hypothetical protein
MIISLIRLPSAEKLVMLSYLTGELKISVLIAEDYSG